MARNVGFLSLLKEFHLQGNRLKFLPPEFVLLEELFGTYGVAKLENNPWVAPIKEQLSLGINKLIEYLNSSTYANIYKRHYRNL